MEMLLIILLMGLVPMVVYTTFLWWLDHWEREPWYLIALAFLWGAIPSVVLVIISHSMIDVFISPSLFYEESIDHLWYHFAVGAPLTEEISKGIALLILFLALRHHIDSLMDGLVYGAAVGFGFAANENIAYFAQAAMEWGELPAGFVFLRAFAFGLNHAFFTGLTGLGFALAKFQTNRAARVLCPLLGLLLAMLFHGAHNSLAVMELFAPGHGLARALALHSFGIFWMIVLVVISLLVQWSWVRHYLGEEVQRGVITAWQCHLAGSLYHSLTSRGPEHRFHQLCAKLAMMKHAHARLGEKGQSMEDIEQVRAQVAQMSRQLVEAESSPKSAAFHRQAMRAGPRPG